jgi:hypothetical protein
MASPKGEPLPRASPPPSVYGQSPPVFTVDAIDMQSACVPLPLTHSNTLVGYYPKKEFQALDGTPNVSLLQQGFIGCTPVRPQLAVAINVYDFYTAACGVHPSFSIEAFARTLCLVYKVSSFLC